MNMNCSLNSLEGFFGDYIGDTKGDTQSLDYSSGRGELKRGMLGV